MIRIVIALSLLVGALDFRYYRRRMRSRRRGVRVPFIVFAAATDLLPLIAGGLFGLLPDNSTATVAAAMWLFYVYLLTVLPRLAFYFFQHFGLARTGAAAAGLTAVLLVWGAVYARTSYAVNEVEVSSERLPEGFDGLRIVHFSDLHIGTLVHPEREMKRLVRTIDALRPDLVVFTGDLVNIRYTELDSAAMRILSQLRAPLGVVSNIGNHDTGVYVKDTLALPVEVNTDSLVARQRRMGWRLPDNETEYLVRGGDTITLSGISFDPAFRRERHDRNVGMNIGATYEGVSRTPYNITLSHLPQLWDRIRELGYGDLTLSGHVHAMQIKARIGKWRFSPARLFYKRWSGRYDEEGSTLYINDGIGYVGFPMRLGAYPEITVITLRR